MYKPTTEPPRIAKLLFLFAVTAGSPAFAGDDSFTASLSGSQSVVFNANGDLVPGGTGSPATGKAGATFDKGFTRVDIDIEVEGLIGNLAAAHFHCGRPGVNGPVAFGLISPGSLVFDGKRIRGTLTSADFTGADCGPVVGRPINNIAALAFAMRDGLIYLNLHTDAFPGGEIRGQMRD